MINGMYAIETDQLSRSFGTLKAVDRLTLEVPRGIVFGFLGPNGSGKTTTIRLLLGLLDADQGNARVLGFDPKDQGGEVRMRCGALLEHHGLYERLSAADNLDYYGRIWHLSKAEREMRIRELLEPLDLYDRRAEPIGRWSRGMKQKLAVARLKAEDMRSKSKNPPFIGRSMKGINVMTMIGGRIVWERNL